jgi:carboxymethylenebutenolidase
MCHDLNAAPSVEPGPHAVLEAEYLLLHSADGSSFASYLARPEHARGTGLLLLPDQRGLAPFYERLAERLAEHGHATLAIDYYGRTAGSDLRGRPPWFPSMRELLALDRAQLIADIEVACEYLRAPGPVGCHTFAVLGFCLGGRLAFLCSGNPDVARAVGFYGAPGIAGPYGPGPTQQADRLRAPILGIFGGADDGIPAGEVGAFDRALSDAGIEHEIVSYPGAPHGFFDVHHMQFAEASADAWQRALTFLEQHAAGTRLAPLADPH